MIVCAVALLVAAAAARAQEQPRLTPEQYHKLDALADDVKQALALGDLAKAARSAHELDIAIFKVQQSAEPTAEGKLRSLEQSPERRTAWKLIFLSWTALDAHDFAKAERYAQETLAAAADAKDPWHGDAIYCGNQVLGRIALERDNDVPRASEYLLASGRTPGSALLGYGANMTLAKGLLEAGERDVVIQFFGLCRAFWKRGGTKLDEWTATVKGGGIPDFGVNLRYP